jgi:hypothetical protein
LQARAGESGLMQDSPETIVSIREVVAVGGRGGCWIDAAEDHVEPCREDIGFVLAHFRFLPCADVS